MTAIQEKEIPQRVRNGQLEELIESSVTSGPTMCPEYLLVRTSVPFQSSRGPNPRLIPPRIASARESSPLRTSRSSRNLTTLPSHQNGRCGESRAKLAIIPRLPPSQDVKPDVSHQRDTAITLHAAFRTFTYELLRRPKTSCSTLKIAFQEPRRYVRDRQ